MKAVGQDGDQGTNCSNTQEVEELEVEFMALLLSDTYYNICKVSSNSFVFNLSILMAMGVRGGEGKGG